MIKNGTSEGDNAEINETRLEVVFYFLSYASAGCLSRPKEEKEQWKDRLTGGAAV